MAKQSIVSIATSEDLSNWEFVNRFDFEIEADFDNDDESIYELVESIDSLSSSSLSEIDDDDDDEKEGTADDIVAHHDEDVKSVRVSDLGENHVGYDVDLSNSVENQHDKDDAFYDGSNLNLHGYGHVHDDVHQHYDDDDGHHDVDENDDDGRYDIDDELVPWEVKDRFVRQRIRKSGKNSFGKLAKSKKSALVFTRPGCVRGKHGLGLKVY